MPRPLASVLLRSWLWPTRARTLILVGAVAAAGWLVATWLIFLRTDERVPAQADAVVVLAGGRGERLARALQLVDQGRAPALVISNGAVPTWPAANAVCQNPPPGVTVLCPAPDPDTTGGEAAMLARLVAEHGWRRVAVVTSDYHALRAELWLDRCAAGRYHVTMVEARPRGNLAWKLARSIREQAGLLAAFTVQRDCPVS